ncbi:5-formyltetrahydrofolate cyclo-ligase [Vannielia litorea]|uniref:5-formyltetrahydrofolate cyclo-ligase n=1 Tax=Vannielia litorea TaxID=1217970 RepID=UPI001C9394A0|nr:5-formyltetrahydrofolate cyclo-ligase [Vannielia litorea]MBY6152138.1 5-formyltetrahydrofolate cyclo-ligase [Vannielia litorea]
MSLAEEKKAARAAALARRAEAHAHWSGHAAGHLSEVLAGYRGVPLAGYMAMRDEIDPLPALEEAAAHGPVGLPTITAPATPLVFRLWEPGAEMVPAQFGTSEPTGEVMRPEILVVPLVAFTRAGARLGYGGGFYDRTLELLRRDGPVLAIGFAYSAQEAEFLPQEPTDAPLDMIVTEAGVLTF